MRRDFLAVLCRGGGRVYYSCFGNFYYLKQIYPCRLGGSLVTSQGPNVKDFYLSNMHPSTIRPPSNKVFIALPPSFPLPSLLCLSPFLSPLSIRDPPETRLLPRDPWEEHFTFGLRLLIWRTQEVEDHVFSQHIFCISHLQ